MPEPEGQINPSGTWQVRSKGSGLGRPEKPEPNDASESPVWANEAEDRGHGVGSDRHLIDERRLGKASLQGQKARNWAVRPGMRPARGRPSAPAAARRAATAGPRTPICARTTGKPGKHKTAEPFLSESPRLKRRSPS